MSDPVTYNFYGTTVPVLRSISISAANIIRAAQAEQSKGNMPSDQEILDSKLGDMLPFRTQPILLAKFIVAALEYLKLAQVDLPALGTDFKTLDEVVELLQSLKKVLENIDEKAYNDAAQKSVDIPIGSKGPILHMTGFADYFHGFVVPNAYFHLNAMYMLLRSAGFKLGKGVYIGSFMSEQQHKDWAPMRG
ncbi:uncharacterized protein EKO05_0009398 [Ascochyta rabiei]|uniref:Uncharacterized protein n=1 Tax=Didymella rabiei TaxID=5454 RepID=A0A162WCM2_DIDRA|nr:uncharacterized protein EKO05_0009398 [Ascochyta rabiei]KZM18950.1 hypothetical protein ST47_g9908 [Ascochyta rabiei]UPX19126.1 hypothetical protein EKO05_0009398 [Ascochyta rabiei]